MPAPVVNGVTLALIPNNADIITSGDQYVDPRLLPGLLASAADFRAEVGKPVFVREGYRSDADQRTIFLARYYRVPNRTGVFYDGSYWQKRTGASVAAIPGSAAANHRLGLCLDLWSGIDVSFTSREHLVWVRVSKRHGWDNTGRGFGEPWHQQGTPGVSPAGSIPTPFPEQEDTLSAAEVKQIIEASEKQHRVTRELVIAEVAKVKATLDNTEKISSDTRDRVKDLIGAIASNTYDGLPGGMRAMLNDVRQRLAVVQGQLVDEVNPDGTKGGMRALLRRVVRKTGA
jgi:hypothetical protein